MGSIVFDGSNMLDDRVRLIQRVMLKLGIVTLAIDVFPSASRMVANTVAYKAGCWGAKTPKADWPWPCGKAVFEPVHPALVVGTSAPRAPVFPCHSGLLSDSKLPEDSLALRHGNRYSKLRLSMLVPKERRRVFG